MGLLLAFMPFLVFALLERLVGTVAGLAGATVVSALLLARSLRNREYSVKILDVGTLVLFGSLTAAALLTGAKWSVMNVRLWVDSGLLGIVLFTLLVRQPFTLQYARDQTPPEIWGKPEFIQTNYVLTAVWVAAFAVMVVWDLLALYATNLPSSVGFVLTVVAIVAAVRFTQWYRDRQRNAEHA